MESGTGTNRRNARGKPTSWTPNQLRSHQLMIQPMLAAYADIVSRRSANEPNACHMFGSAPFRSYGRTMSASVLQNVTPADATARRPPPCCSARLFGYLGNSARNVRPTIAYSYRKTGG